MPPPSCRFSSEGNRSVNGNTVGLLERRRQERRLGMVVGVFQVEGVSEGHTLFLTERGIEGGGSYVVVVS